MTPGGFLLSVRMRAAGRLLATTDMPIKCLAAAVGYASRSQFSRTFKLARRGPVDVSQQPMLGRRATAGFSLGEAGEWHVCDGRR